MTDSVNREIEERIKPLSIISDEVPGMSGRVRFMVGDVEMSNVISCKVHEIEPDSLVEATIRVFVRLGK